MAILLIEEIIDRVIQGGLKSDIAEGRAADSQNDEIVISAFELVGDKWGKL